MGNNDYLYGMLKSEEHTVEVLTSDLHEEKRRRHAAEKGKRESDRRVEMLEKKVYELQTQLAAKVEELSKLMHQVVQFMMGNGSVSLSESLKESLIAGVRAEYERREAEIRQSYELEIAALRNENNALKNKDGQNPSSDSPTSQGGPSIETRLKSAEQQRADLAVTAHGQRTESGKYHHGSQQVEDADTLDLNGEDVPAERVVELAKGIKERKDMNGISKPRRPQPLFDALDDVDLEKEAAKPEDERNVVVLRPEGLPEDAFEIGQDVTERVYWVSGHMRVRRIIRKKYKDPRGNYYEVNLPEKYKNCMGRTSATESLIVEILTMHFYYNMTIGDIEKWLHSMGLNFSHSTIMGWIESAADILEPLDEVLQQEILSDTNVHSDETTLKTCDRRLPDKGEREEDVEPEEHYFKRWLFSHYSPMHNLVQYVFHERGRRTREAEQKYLEDVKHKIYLHSDGAQLYKCYDTTELIVRVACLVHIRRPIYKLRHIFTAGRIVKIIDLVFHLDKEIKKDYKDNELIREQRCLQIGPLLNDLKSELESLRDALDPAKEPELLKAVNYALKEYPCILHCLEDGTVDFSNNCCERQIRRIAKYRNNSFFVGSPAAGKRFARLQSVFGNIRNHKLNPQIYLCDVFRYIKKLAKEGKEEMVNMLANRWQPVLLLAKLNY